MKTIRRTFFALAIVFLSSTMCISSCTGQEKAGIVNQAYDLRITGRADSAMTLLEAYLEKNETDALAWYELSRIHMHMGGSNPGRTGEKLELAGQSIDRAVENDPQNAFYIAQRGRIECLELYLRLQKGDDDASEKLLKIEERYNAAFKIDPEYFELKMTLVELFGGLPADMGGDLSKADKYTLELESADPVWGAKAREILMPEDADYVAFWENIVQKYPDNADALEALARIHLLMGNVQNAKKCYENVLVMEPSRNHVYLTMARYYMMMVMQGTAEIDSVVSLIEDEYTRYLSSEPEPCNPMKAWVKSSLAKVKYHAGDKEAGDRLMTEAQDLDPYFSRAFGTPDISLYVKPGKECRHHVYYFTPF